MVQEQRGACPSLWAAAVESIAPNIGFVLVILLCY